MVTEVLGQAEAGGLAATYGALHLSLTYHHTEQTVDVDAAGRRPKLPSDLGVCPGGKVRCCYSVLGAAR